jgi:alpha-acetolactate decarboxylase
MYQEHTKHHQPMNLFKLMLTGWAILAFAGGCASHTVRVMQYGKMREVLGGGAAAASPCVSLDEALRTPHAYAVGALPRLEGEITVIDGRAWIARPRGNELSVEGPTATPAENAAMLTIAYINRWDEFKIEQHLDGDVLEAFIADRARESGIDLREPFPFLIEGRVSDLQAHVVNGACPMKPGARLAADQQPWRFQQELPRKATIVGFYAADSVGKMTHPGTSIHAHALLEVDGTTVTGHVERMAVGPDAILKLPSAASGAG